MHEYSEVSFDIEKSHEYILSIQVSLNGFSFSIHRLEDKTLMAFKSVPLQISSSSILPRRFKEWIYSEEMLQKQYLKTRIIVFSDQFTLIPSSFESKHLKEEVVHSLFNNAVSIQFPENWLPGLNAKLLFSVPDGLLQVLSETVGETELVHPLKGILLHLLAIPHRNILFVLFDKNNIQLILFKEGKLLLVNNFSVSHENDVVFYVLSTLKNFSFQVEDAGLLFSGASAFMEGSMATLKKHKVNFERFSMDSLKIATEIPDEVCAEHLSLFL